MIQTKTLEYIYSKEEENELLRKTFGNGLNDLEFELFTNICKLTRLNPFTKQIYPVKISGKMSVITGIDGLRTIAERTGNYSPGREPSFQYDKDGSLLSATAYVKKKTSDGTWHEVSATAFFSEYKPAFGSNFWRDKPHIMISKCAEGLAIRRAFPAVTANLYTEDEMEQAKPEKIAEYSPVLEISSSSEGGIDLLKELLCRDGIAVERLDEWIGLRCQVKNETPEKIVQLCLERNTFPKFKESFIKWAESVRLPE